MQSLAVVALLLVASPAFAGGSGGHDGGGTGRLGQVTSGIDKATDKPSGSSSSTSNDDDDDDDRSDSYECCTTYSSGGSSGGGGDWTMPHIDVDVEAFAGAQKVHESGGSLSAALSLVFSQRARLNLRASHYFEDEMDGSRITMTLPALTAGLRVGDLGASKFWLEGGVAHVRTVDPAGSAALWGSTFGVAATHAVSADTTFVANANVILFDGVQAYGGRAGVRFHHVELAFSVLDFSVGPALYGPELGFGF